MNSLKIVVGGLMVVRIRVLKGVNKEEKKAKKSQLVSS